VSVGLLGEEVVSVDNKLRPSTKRVY